MRIKTKLQQIKKTTDEFLLILRDSSDTKLKKLQRIEKKYNISIPAEKVILENLNWDKIACIDVKCVISINGYIHTCEIILNKFASSGYLTCFLENYLSMRYNIRTHVYVYSPDWWDKLTE